MVAGAEHRPGYQQPLAAALAAPPAFEIVLVTGSYNWTESAEVSNFENALFLDDPALVARYVARFERLFASPPVRPAAR